MLACIICQELAIGGASALGGALLVGGMVWRHFKVKAKGKCACECHNLEGDNHEDLDCRFDDITPVDELISKRAKSSTS